MGRRKGQDGYRVLKKIDQMGRCQMDMWKRLSSNLSNRITRSVISLNFHCFNTKTYTTIATDSRQGVLNFFLIFPVKVPVP
jgi:hypothetical protein